MALVLTISTSAQAATALSATTLWGPTHLAPGGKGKLAVIVKNYGSNSAEDEQLTVKVELPPGVTRVKPTLLDEAIGSNGPNSIGESSPSGGKWKCAGESVVTCQSVSDGAASLGARIGQALFRIQLRLEISSNAPPGTYDVPITVSDGTGASPRTDLTPITISPTPAPFGVVPGGFKADAFDERPLDGDPVRQAGARPFELRVNFKPTETLAEAPPPKPGTSTALFVRPDEDFKTAEVTLPRGMIGNPEATPKCSPEEFLTQAGREFQGTGCPPETQVGTMALELSLFPYGNDVFPFLDPTRTPVYNLEPPKGVAADFGFHLGPYRGHIFPVLDPAQGYAINAVTPHISSALLLRSVEFTMWGVPADPAHDFLRANPFCGRGLESGYPVCSEDPAQQETTGAIDPFGIAANPNEIKPLLTMPMNCGERDTFKIRAESWQNPGVFSAVQEPLDPPLEVEGCDDPRIRFEPKVLLQPTSRSAGGPTGLDVHLEVPQRNDAVEDAEELYEQNGDVQAIPIPPMKKAVVTFPEGMTLSTSAAQGLGVCTAAEIGIGTNDPVRCPENSRYGALTLHTPILPKDEPMVGDIFIAKKNDNPFNNFLSMYFVIHDEDRGLLIKIPGKIDLDPRTGQIRTTFDELPQFPVSDMQLTFKSGVRAALVNPTTCGTKTIKAEFYSWADPTTPKVVTDSYQVTQRPNGSPCINSLAERPFNPELSAGTVNPNAGSYSPFVFRLKRTDDDQEFSQLSTTLPPGLLANISKITECPEAGIALAESKGRTGTAEQLFPSCPASSFLGTTDVGSGVGQVITYIPGKAYLAGPYKGAPLSMVVISPILAGPYDLGVIAVRSTIHIDPSTAQASVQTEPFPQIYEGIPVRLRDIRVKVDRPNTTLNPTSCDPMAVSARVTGTGGNLDSTADDTAVTLSERFQAANCASLPFKPKLSFKLKGGTKRGDFPALEATLRARPGDANIARSTVVLPRSEFIEQGHIRTVCTRVQFAANQCPPGSIYGKASAKSPLFDETLTGPVYLRSNGGERLLPDLVVTLNGKIDVALAGFIDSVKGRVRNTFDVIPDAPVTFFKLSMQGGKRGLLVNHLDLCEITSRAEVKFIGQNGKVSNSRPKMGTSCKGKARKKHKKTTGRGASR